MRRRKRVEEEKTSLLHVLLSSRGLFCDVCVRVNLCFVSVHPSTRVSVCVADRR